MSASLGDVLNRGRLDAFVTNISERAYLFQGNNLRLNFLPELGRFQQGAEGVIADSGWAWERRWAAWTTTGATSRSSSTATDRRTGTGATGTPMRRAPGRTGTLSKTP